MVSDRVILLQQPLKERAGLVCKYSAASLNRRKKKGNHISLHNFRTSCNLPGPPPLARFIISFYCIIIFWEQNTSRKSSYTLDKINKTNLYAVLSDCVEQQREH